MKKTFSFNPELNLGHIIQLIVMVGTVGFMWASTQSDIKVLQKDVSATALEVKTQRETQQLLKENLAVLTSIVQRSEVVNNQLKRQ